MKTSEHLGQLGEALAKAQSKIVNPIKDNKVDFTLKSGGKKQYNFASLDSCLDAVRIPLSSNGLAIIQSPSVVNGRVEITTRLIHDSGEWIESTLSLMPKNGDPQSIASAITYGRRYSLCAIVGIAPEEEDDDGVEATYAPNQIQQPIQARPARIENDFGAIPINPHFTITEAQENMLHNLISKYNEDGRKNIESYMQNTLNISGFNELHLLNVETYEGFIHTLERGLKNV